VHSGYTLGRICRGAGLDGKLVFSAVAKVVLVTGQVPGRHQVTGPELLLVERLELSSMPSAFGYTERAGFSASADDVRPPGAAISG
jgi:hypothetical protein